MRKTGIFFIFWMTVAAMPHPALAAKSLHEIKKDLDATKALHAELTEKTKTLKTEVSSLNKNLVSVSRDLQASEDGMMAADARLRGLQERKSTLLEALYKDQQALGGLVSAARRYSQASVPALLMQGSVLEAARAGTVMKSAIPALDRESSALKARLAEVAKVEGEIRAQYKIQAAQKEKLDAQQEKLATLLEERKRIYAATVAERMEQEKEVARLTKESRTLEELMQNVKKKSSRQKQGQLAAIPPGMRPPVRGVVKTAFGEKDALGAQSRGITFSPREKAQIIAPLSGIVKFAGPFQNYRQILIVEHGGGYHSLIAGLGRIDTVVGAELATGEPVGIAEAETPRIYYELRQNGKPVNPGKLLIAERKQEKG